MDCFRHFCETGGLPATLAQSSAPSRVALLVSTRSGKYTNPRPQMAAWQLVALCTVLFIVVAGAQESTLDAATLANNPPGAFVYVPSATVEGQITVKRPSRCSLSLEPQSLSHSALA